jgi:ATP-dependent helicase Lhr and Lhr-like helicase
MTSSHSNSEAGPAAFSLLHPCIQEQLYRMKWTELRPIQVHAIHALLGGKGHLIISAMTAGGKTEAAFLPILSHVVDATTSGVQALYIGPLKALINDQFRRLEDLCALAEIPVHKWHGDVGASAKRDLIAAPSGVLLITPESVESLFINRTNNLPALFGNLAFIVIDEMHSFMGSERGAHLKSLISRLTQICSSQPRLVGLSATLGDIELAKQWLCPRDPASVHIITGEGDKTIRYRIKGYLRLDEDGAADSSGSSSNEAPEGPTETEDDRRLATDLIRTFSGKTSLIFANSRAKLEFYADLTRRILERKNLPNTFRVHHGSLSKAEREDTEEALRSDRPTSTFCSSTLELGIDVGNVVAVGQIGAPWSVSSLAQRLGRSGRKSGEPSVLLMFVEEDHPNRHAALVPRLCPGLLQAVAMTELLFKKWCEPPEVTRLHLSTLIQQIMSLIAERGGVSAATVFDVLVKRGAFTAVDQPTLVSVLRGLGANDMIEQTPEGDLILGIKGERVVRSSDFYSAFASSEDMKVYFKGHLIGTVSAPPGLGADGYLILAGRRWKVIEIDPEKREILVEPAKGGRLPFFSGKSGADIHPRVRAEMLAVLKSQDRPVYLDDKARDILGLARDFARHAGIADNPIITDGPDTYWFTWTGSRIHRTLMGMGRFLGGLDIRDEDIALCFEKTPPETVRETYLKLLATPPDADCLAMEFPVCISEKYDVLLPDDLQAMNFARNNLDVEATQKLIQKTFCVST